MKKINFLLLLFLGSFISAQIISGQVFSEQESKPIPYAKIGVAEQKKGTISDENGNFKLDLSTIDAKANLTVEVSGYEKHVLPVSKLQLEQSNLIYLKDRVRDLEEVIISPKKYVQKNWGNRTKSKTIQIGHNPTSNEDDRSKEIALFFKNNKKVKIEKINLNISTFETDQPVFIRFNIYDKNMNAISTEDLHDEITPEKIVDGAYTLDVSKLGVWLKEDFYVSLQMLNYFKGTLFLSGALMGNKSVYRNYLGEWEKVPVVSPSLNIDVRVEK